MVGLRFALEGFLSNFYGDRLRREPEKFNETPFLIFWTLNIVFAEYVA